MNKSIQGMIRNGKIIIFLDTTFMDSETFYKCTHILLSAIWYEIVLLHSKIY